MNDLAILLQGIAALAWPMAFILAVFLFRDKIAEMLSRNVSIKGVGLELTVAAAAEQTGKSVSELVTRVAELEEKITENGGPRGVTGRVEKRAISVLWVDDFPANNAFLIQQFEMEGVHITKEFSTETALRAIKQREFDAIISDLGRKENGVENSNAGLDLIRSARESGIKTPLIIFAGRRAVEMRDQLVAAGANEVTNSGVDLVHFLNKIRTVK